MTELEYYAHWHLSICVCAMQRARIAKAYGIGAAVVLLHVRRAQRAHREMQSAQC